MEPEDPADGFKNQGNAEFKKKNFDEAISFYNKAIELKAEEPLYYNNKAAVYIETGEYGKALEEVNKAEKLFEDGTVKDFAKKAKVLARKAAIFAKQNKLEEAIGTYEKSLMEDHNQRAKDEMNRLKKIKKEEDALKYINPELGEQHCEEGNKLFKEGKFPAAIKEY